MRIPEKIQKGAFVVEQTERKINAIIDCLHAMQPLGDGGRIKVNQTSQGSIISFDTATQVKEVVQTVQVQDWNYEGPWSMKLTDNGLSAAIKYAPIQINGRFSTPEDMHLSGEYGYADLAVAFSEVPSSQAYTRKYATLETYLIRQPGSIDEFYWSLILRFNTREQLLDTWNDPPGQVSGEIGGRGYYVIGEAIRTVASGVTNYAVNSYIPGIPQFMAVAYTDPPPAAMSAYYPAQQ